MHDSNDRDDFEEYLKDQVSSHRMYPSDRVWQNIRGKVHTPKKWPALSVFTVLIISGLVLGTLLNKPAPDAITPNFAFSLQSPQDEISKANLWKNLIFFTFTVLFPLMLTQMVRSIKRWQHTLFIYKSGYITRH